MTAQGEVDVAISQSIIDETLRVLQEKFGLSQAELDRALTIMESCTRKVEPTIKLDVVKDDPKDNHVIECAVTAR